MQPFIFKLDAGKHDISDGDNIILSSTINEPQCDLGFHILLHRTKSALTITNNPNLKNGIYNVVNSFEDITPNYEDSLINLTKKYLNIKDKSSEIIDRSFYKMWEILFIFELAKDKEMTFASISESPTAFIQAIINFREKLGTGIAKDKAYSVSINPEKGNHATTDQQFTNFYNNVVPGLINVHRVRPQKPSKKNMQHTSPTELTTSLKTISSFKKEIEKTKKYIDLITADGEIQWDKLNYQEQEAYQLIFGEIIAALKVQAKDGNFVLKIFETYTLVTIKMIYLLTSFYDECFVFKPLFSRPSNSEKYIICKKFKYDQKKDSVFLDAKIANMEKVLEKIKGNKFVFDIYPKLTIPMEYLHKIKFINIKISNQQQIVINKIVTFIKEDNFFGDKYQKYRDIQIESIKWWTNTFYPPSNNLYEKNKEDVEKYIKQARDKFLMESIKFITNQV